MGGNLKGFSFSGLKKNILWMCLFLLLIAGIVPVVQSQFPTTSVDPSEYTVSEPGETFTIDVNFTHFSPFKYYEFKLGFDNALLNATQVIPGPINPAGSIFGPRQNISGTMMWTPLQNVSDGFVWVTANLSTIVWESNGTLMTINFTALEEGECKLDLYDDLLINPPNPPLVHSTDDGYIWVIPEFPAAIVAPLLLIATVAAAALGKIFWSRKRKSPRQTKITTKESY